jgi:hypothetical protein
VQHSKIGARKVEMGQSRTFGAVRRMSGLPSIADIARRPSRAKTGCEQSQQSRPYSMIWLARASSVGGASRLSALAVLRLITSSYLVGACTGKSAGFSPLRMRST